MSRLSISNIAWDASEDEAVAALLRAARVDAIDVAPGKYFPDPVGARTSDIESVRQWWAVRGIEIIGMQALLFGTTGLNLFGTDASRQAMLDHLNAVCRIGAGLGATRLAFGSPRNRDRTGLDDAATAAIALPFFRRMGELAAAHGVMVCLEPNPPRYGANYMTTSHETAAVVRAVNHPAVRMQLDTGALAINGEDPAEVIGHHADLIAHVHASEPDLVPVGDAGAPHGAVAGLLRQHLPALAVTIEMVATKAEPHLDSIERALRAAHTAYRTARPAGAAS